MTQKNETPALIISLLVTLGLLGAGAWWLAGRSGVQLPNVSTTQSPGASPEAGSKSSATSPYSAGSNNSASSANGAAASFPAGTFKYGGSSSWAPLRLSVDGAIAAANPAAQLQYTNPTKGAPGSGTGISMLVDGTIAFAQSSRPVTDEEYQAARQQGFTLKQVAIAVDGLAVAVNPSLPISGLTLEQLKGIYLGQITNWQQVGGPALPIVPISRDASSGGTVELFIEQVVNKQPLNGGVQIVNTTTQALQVIGSTPGSIYFASAPEIVPQCSIRPLPIGRASDQLIAPYQEPLTKQCPNPRNQLNIAAFQKGDYPLIRNLYVVIKQNGQAEQKAGEAYANFLLSPQGQDLVAKAGFVKVR